VKPKRITAKKLILHRFFLKCCNFIQKKFMIDKLTILRDLKTYLQKGLDNSVSDLVLFGSQVHGNSDDYSDYDILIILDKEYNAHDENKVYDLCYDIDLKYNIIIDAHMIHQGELNTLRGKQPIYTRALKTGLYA